MYGFQARSVILFVTNVTEQRARPLLIPLVPTPLLFSINTMWDHVQRLQAVSYSGSGNCVPAR